ncbi:MAG: DJ-1/PfpI family protein [Oscillospiraceae bacterium]|nr:DJ-1/PfpI family protein [Oscillospiraceae bacterium]
MLAVFLAQGFEEIEAIATIDFLRRCDLPVHVIPIGGTQISPSATVVTGSHDISVACEPVTKSINWAEYDAVILPGGLPGTYNLEASTLVQSALEVAHRNGKLIAAICAAPSILAKMKFLAGKRATSFPDFEDILTENGANYTGDFVAADGNIITGKGAGVTIDFANAIAAYFVGDEKALAVRKSMQPKY